MPHVFSYKGHQITSHPDKAEVADPRYDYGPPIYVTDSVDMAKRFVDDYIAKKAWALYVAGDCAPNP